MCIFSLGLGNLYTKRFRFFYSHVYAPTYIIAILKGKIFPRVTEDENYSYDSVVFFRRVSEWKESVITEFRCRVMCVKRRRQRKTL